MKRQLWLAIWAFIVGLTGACNIGGTPEPIAVADSGGDCEQVTSLINQTAALNVCRDFPSDMACYGNRLLLVEYQDAGVTVDFDEAGDQASLDGLRVLTTSARNMESGEWGVAALRIVPQDALGGTWPGDPVTFILYGETRLTDASSNAGEVADNEYGLGQLSAFYFETAENALPQCRDLASELLVHTPRGAQVSFRANGADFTVGSTVLLTAQVNGEMTARVLDGTVTASIGVQRQTARSGMMMTMQLGSSNGLTAQGFIGQPQSFTLSGGALVSGCSLAAQLGLTISCGGAASNPGAGSVTNTPTPSDTPTVTPTSTRTPSPTNSPASTRIPSPTRAPAVTPTVISSGTATLQGTFTFDLESGQQSEGGADIWWNQQSDVERYIVPWGSQRLAYLGMVNFDQVDLATLQDLDYGFDPIDGSDNSSNLLMPGAVFAVLTDEGNYAKVEIMEYGYDLQIRWETYAGDGVIDAGGESVEQTRGDFIQIIEVLPADSTIVYGDPLMVTVDYYAESSGYIAVFVELFSDEQCRLDMGTNGGSQVEIEAGTGLQRVEVVPFESETQPGSVSVGARIWNPDGTNSLAADLNYESRCYEVQSP